MGYINIIQKSTFQILLKYSIINSFLKKESVKFYRVHSNLIFFTLEISFRQKFVLIFLQ